MYLGRAGTSTMSCPGRGVEVAYTLNYLNVWVRYAWIKDVDEPSEEKIPRYLDTWPIQLQDCASSQLQL